MKPIQVPTAMRPSVSRILNQDEKNRKLLYDTLAICYTLQDIDQLKEAIEVSMEYLPTKNRISLMNEVLYREQNIHYIQKNLQKKHYSIVELYHLLRKTTKYSQCDAILLHIEINKETYGVVRCDLSIYQRMVDKRKNFILNQMEVRS